MAELRYRTRPGVVLTCIQGEYLLVSAKNARQFCPYVTGVNETAAYIWHLLEEGSTPDSIVEAILSEYEITDRDTVKQSVMQLLSSLSDAGYLIEIT